jgi:hypothetical protein
MRLSTILTTAAAAAALAVASPASAAFLSVSAGCANGGLPLSGNSPVSLSGVCSNPDIGVATAGAFATFGHLGATSSAASFNNDSLFIDNSANANFEDIIVFSDPTAPIGATTQVSVNMLLDGAFNAATDGHGRAGANVEGLVAFSGGGFNFRFSTDGDGDFDSSISVGSIVEDGRVAMTSPTITVFLNSPILFRVGLATRAAASGPFSSASAEFGSSSFKLPAGGDAFNLADGVTVNAGDWLVNNRFIDPLAPSGGVPEPASWALMILGFGVTGAFLRRRAGLIPA